MDITKTRQRSLEFVENTDKMTKFDKEIFCASLWKNLWKVCITFHCHSILWRYGNQMHKEYSSKRELFPGKWLDITYYAGF